MNLHIDSYQIKSQIYKEKCFDRYRNQDWKNSYIIQLNRKNDNAWLLMHLLQNSFTEQSNQDHETA